MKQRVKDATAFLIYINTLLTGERKKYLYLGFVTKEIFGKCGRERKERTKKLLATDVKLVGPKTKKSQRFELQMLECQHELCGLTRLFSRVT